MSTIYNGLGEAIEISGGGSTVIEPQKNDIPCVYLTGTLPTSKNDGELLVKGQYRSMTESFDFYATAKVQGDLSTSFAKLNYTLKLYTDSAKSKKLKKDFRGWGSRNKFVIKANWIDHLHARNIVNARLWTKIVESRADYNSMPEAFRNCHKAIDGFTIMVFNNGIYLGMYTWNLPKDAMYGLDEDEPGNYLIQSQNTSTIWSTSGDRWADELRDGNPPASWNLLRDLVINGTDTEFVNGLNSALDVRSVVDQYIFLVLACITDNVAKNQTFYTYDAVKFYGGMYDMDGTWGLSPTASGWWSADRPFQDGYGSVTDENPNRLYYRMQTLFTSDIKNRYAVLRNNILSADSIIAEFEDFVKYIPDSLYAEDYAATTGNGNFTNIPLKDTNNIQQVRKFVVDRCAYVDSFIDSL